MSISNQKPTTLQLRGYSLPELANLYQISSRTFKKWIKPFAAEIGKRQGRFYNVNQVKTILANLGFPEVISTEHDLMLQKVEKSGKTPPKTT